MQGLLKKKLTQRELSLVPSSFDVVGGILIFADFPPELEKKQKFIAKCFLEFFRNVKVVCKKTKRYSGVYRTPKLRILAGERRKETTHREHNCVIKLNIETCYFSPRLSTERKRVTKQVKRGEKVLVMFSGVGPYPLVIAKNSKAKILHAVEQNPAAHKYAEQNIMLNKIENLSLHKGDVKRVLPQLKLKFDRVLMPRPKNSEDFIDLALTKLKIGGIVHFYDFLHESEFNEAIEKIKHACQKYKRKFKILTVVKCGQYAPHVYRICVDAKIT